MPLFSPYFPLESNAYRVGKSGQLRRQMGTAGFGLYVMVLSHLRDCPDCTAELDYDALGYELHEDPALVRRVVEDFDLFLLDREHGTFTAEALREVAAAARPRARSKRNNAERHRRERKSSRRTTDNDDALPEETTEEADNDDTPVSGSTSVSSGLFSVGCRSEVSSEGRIFASPFAPSCALLCAGSATWVETSPSGAVVSSAKAWCSVVSSSA